MLARAPSVPAVASVTPGTGLAGVVVPTHNDGANIGRLLERLLMDPQVGEVVVIASACDDETVPTVLENTDARVRLYVEAERSGKAAAVNFGVEQVTLPYVVIVSGDVLPEPGAITSMVTALQRPGVGLAGGRPAPSNPESCAVGHAVQLMWRLHHRLSLHQPKLGEMIALRSEATVSLPRTSVDEACFQAIVEGNGWKSAYVPEAVVVNRGPGSVRDFVKQRRQIHTGHLWLRHREDYVVPSLKPGLILGELWRDLKSEPARLQPRRLAWTAGAVAMEAGARVLARLDYLRGREKHVWDMVKSTKNPSPVANGAVPRGS